MLFHYQIRVCSSHFNENVLDTDVWTCHLRQEGWREGEINQEKVSVFMTSWKTCCLTWPGLLAKRPRTTQGRNSYQTAAKSCDGAAPLTTIINILYFQHAIVRKRLSIRKKRTGAFNIRQFGRQVKLQSQLWTHPTFCWTFNHDHILVQWVTSLKLNLTSSSIKKSQPIVQLHLLSQESYNDCEGDWQMIKELTKLYQLIPLTTINKKIIFVLWSQKQNNKRTI